MKLATMTMVAMLMGGTAGLTSGQAPIQPPSPPQAAPTMGTWKVTGNVQGVSVILLCKLAADADMKVTGTCSGDEGGDHAVKGLVKDQTLTWQFDSTYEGSAITVSLAGTSDATGAKMTGTIGVEPIGADGDFTAVLQPAQAPS
jgi:hypothetical protein